jgi:hypothetical protein
MYQNGYTEILTRQGPQVQSHAHAMQGGSTLSSNLVTVSGVSAAQEPLKAVSQEEDTNLDHVPLTQKIHLHQALSIVAIG